MAAPTPCTVRATTSAANDGARAQHVEEGRFLLGDEPCYFVGTNFWYGPILGSEGPGGDRARLGRDRDAGLRPLVREAFEAGRGRYGYRRVHAELRRHAWQRDVAYRAVEHREEEAAERGRDGVVDARAVQPVPVGVANEPWLGGICGLHGFLFLG